MKIPLSWLRTYVDVTMPPKELGHRLTMAGLEAAGYTVIGGSWDNVLVGRVVSVEPHPNADRLRLATVDLGTEQMTVVCGAPTVAAGQRIAFAKEGARLVDPASGKVETLKAARIRGVVSAGMVCSERELGLGTDHTGILVLDDSAPIGVPLADYLGDVVLDSEVTPNRPDWLSVLGVAHEVAALAGMIASELQANVTLAKRAGLLHDIGKAVDREVEGSDAAIGAELMQRWDEAPEIAQDNGEHHNEDPTTSILGYIVSAADAISGARPGARRESVENYIKRLETLESIANSFKGVEKSFAIQAGREIRILVKPEEINDLDSIRLARDIVKKIEEGMEYPGQIKVTVIRETRAIDFAK